MALKLYSQICQKRHRQKQLTSTRLKKNSNREIGNLYEQIALDYLLAQGLSFIERNFHVRGGELDLIMQDGDALVFVEVKYRTSVDFGQPLEAVNRVKMQRIYKAAMLWMAKRGIASNSCYFRFDIISIQDNKENIQWLKNIMLEGYKAN